MFHRHLANLNAVQRERLEWLVCSENRHNAIGCDSNKGLFWLCKVGIVYMAHSFECHSMQWNNLLLSSDFFHLLTSKDEFESFMLNPGI